MARQDRKTVYPTIRVSFKRSRTERSIPLRVIPVIAYAQENTPSGIMKSSVTAFPHIKKDAALTGGIFGLHIYLLVKPFTRLAIFSSCASSNFLRSLIIASSLVGFLVSRSKNSLTEIPK